MRTANGGTSPDVRIPVEPLAVGPTFPWFARVTRSLRMVWITAAPEDS
jgi:hypothetical protein